LFYESSFAYQGVLIDPPALAPDISLVDQDGSPFHLDDQRGKFVLVFFGYTHCPDVCPITLSEFKQVKAALGERAGQVEFVFITVDPERDTPERIQGYLANFDPEFIGLTGTEQQLEEVWRAYGVYQERQDSGSAAGYLVDHSARTYLIDSQGQWRLNYPFGMGSEKMIRDVEHILKEKP
jgi:protein SCO1/2